MPQFFEKSLFWFLTINCPSNLLTLPCIAALAPLRPGCLRSSRGRGGRTQSPCKGGRYRSHAQTSVRPGKEREKKGVSGYWLVFW